MKGSKMKKMKKRILAALLCTTMMLNTGMSAMADGGTAVSSESAHVHTEECYEKSKTDNLICTKAETAEGHVHGDECYEVTSTPELICTQAETAGHTHGDSCMETTKNLTCGAEEHTHGGDCYETETKDVCSDESEEHTCGDGCVETEEVLKCKKSEHTHDDGCYESETKMVCGQDEVEAHTHGEGCYTTAENKTLKCTLEEVEAHTHNDECYAWEEKLVCTLAETAPAAEQPEKEEKAEEAEEAAEVNLQNDDETGIKVSVKSTSDVLSEDTKVVVAPMEIDEEHEAALAEAVSEFEVLGYTAYDISLKDAEDADITLGENKVEVTIDFEELIPEGINAEEVKDVVLVHITTDEEEKLTAETVGTVEITEEKATVEFEADSFSPYVVTYLSETEEAVEEVVVEEPVVEDVVLTYTSEDEAYTATVTAAPEVLENVTAFEAVPVTVEEPTHITLEKEVDGVKVILTAEEGVVPEDAELSVTPITADNEETKEQYEEVAAQLNEKAEADEQVVQGFLAYDITLVDSEGNEFEPNGEVKVSMEYKKAVIPEEVELADDLTVTVHHFEEDENGEVKQIVDMIAEETIEAAISLTEAIEIEKAEFKTTSFSTYAVTWAAERAAVAAVDEADLTIEVGESGTISTSESMRGYSWRVVDQYNRVVSNIRVNYSNKTLTVVANENAEPGEYKIQRGWSNRYTDYYTVSVTAASGTYTVYVYVGSYTDSSRTEVISDECIELLGIDKNTIDGNGYFPVGEIQIAKSLITSKGNAATTPGQPLITSQADWEAVLAALGQLDTSTLIDELGEQYSNNRGNKVGEYLSQAAGDINYNWGTMRTALFRWNDTENYGFKDESIKYHLDLRFFTNKITFITGNNGISSGAAKDLTTVDSRTYITGSIIQPPRNLNIPEGYKFAGYFTDPDFETEWNGIGTPLNKDQTVYIRIVEEKHVVLYYKVAQGEGTVAPDMEHFNPITTEEATGSTANETNLEYVFDGWYSDEACTTLITKDEKYEPSKPADGWESIDGTTYWAKFVPAKQTLTITKTVSGNMADPNKEFIFGVEIDGERQDPFTLKHGANKTFEVPVGVTVTITENSDGYTRTVNTDPGYKETEDGNGITFAMPANDKQVTFNNDKTAYVKVVKTWNGPEANVPEQLAVNLMKGESQTVATATMVESADGKWEVVLPITEAWSSEWYVDEVVPVEYSDFWELASGGWKQETIDGNITYITETATYEGKTVECYVYNLVNELNTKSVAVQKVWDDNENTYRSRPEELDITLTYERGSGENKVSGDVTTIIIDANGNGEITPQEVTINGVLYDITVSKIKVNDTVWEATISGLPNGYAYDFVEGSINGYKQTGKTISDDTVILTNSIDVRIIKTDATDNKTRLSGAIFELEGEDTYYGKSQTDGLVEWYTDRDLEDSSKINANQIPNGTYTLREVQAPSGYAVSAEKWSIEVKSGVLKIAEKDLSMVPMYEKPNGKILFYAVYFENEMLYELPSTGGHGIHSITLSGLTLMLGAAYVWFTSRREESSNN